MSRLSRSVLPHFVFDKAPMPSQWCEENLVIPKKMSPRSPGPLSLRSRPWARPILDCWHPDSGVRRINVAIAVQMAKTTLMSLGVVYRMVHSPQPVMIVGGMSEKFARREISEKRLHPLINSNQVLRELKPHDSNEFRALEMMMAYAPILVTGAGSDTNLAGSTQGIVAIDEAAKIEHHDSEESQEAHPIRLAEDRTKEFNGQELIWKSSTVNTPNHIFWQDVEAGTYTHFAVPCPHCREYWCFEFESRDGEKVLTPGQLGQTMNEAQPEIYRSVVWSPEARNGDGTWNEQKVRDTAHYVCPKNGCKIIDSDKPGMLQKFEEDHRNPKAAMSNRSFRVPAFYSPTRSFGDIAWQFTNRGDLFNTGLQVFYNHELALPWEDIDLQLKDEDIWGCRATGDIAYQRGHVPNRDGILVAGADWGERETHWVVGLIDREGNIWIVDWGSVTGIRDLIRAKEEWGYYRPNEPTRRVIPIRGFVDSGDNTSEVYKMCQSSSSFWWPTKGSDASSGDWHQTVLKNYPGLSLYTFSDKVAKDELYDLRIHQKKGRRLYLPENANHEIIAGLSGQKRLDHGFRSRWKKVKNDHAGDAIKNIQTMSWVISNDRKAA